MIKSLIKEITFCLNNDIDTCISKKNHYLMAYIEIGKVMTETNGLLHVTFLL